MNIRLLTSVFALIFAGCAPIGERRIDASTESATLGHATSDGNLRKNLETSQITATHIVPESLLEHLQSFDCNATLGSTTPQFFTTGLYQNYGNLYYRELNREAQCVTIYVINYFLRGNRGCAVNTIRQYNGAGIIPHVARAWALSPMDPENTEIRDSCSDGVQGMVKELPRRQ